MIIEFKVKCDRCGRIINALEEFYLETSDGDICKECDTAEAMGG